MAAAVLAAVQTFTREAEWNEKKHTIFLNVGYGRIMSAMEGAGDLELEDLRNVVAEQIGYTYSFNRNIAIGGMFNSFTSEQSMKYEGETLDVNLLLSYIAPQFVFTVPFSEQSRWSFDLRGGVGLLCVYQSTSQDNRNMRVEASTTDVGWGFNAAAGIECRVSKLICITATLSDTFGQFRSEYDDGWATIKEWTEINRLSFTAGVKFHF